MQVYSPGLLVSDNMTWRSRRILPLAGDVLVTPGTKVQADTIVARTSLPGDATPIPVARLLGISPAKLANSLKVPVGGFVKAGEILAAASSVFGLFHSQVEAPLSGSVMSISPVTGQLVLQGKSIDVEVNAHIAGVVVEVLSGEGAVIEADVAVVQGIFGIGGEAYGPLEILAKRPTDDLEAEFIGPQHRGRVIVGGARVTEQAVRQAIKHRVAGIITGGIDDADLRQILGYDLGVAVTGTEKIGITLIVTEGFGEIAMAERTFALLASLKGQQASIDGTTQIRAGVQRPEVLIPREIARKTTGPAAGIQGQALAAGLPVRIVREPDFGKLGKVLALPRDLRMLESESRARVVEVQLQDGQTVIVPRANVELIEG